MVGRRPGDLTVWRWPAVAVDSIAYRRRWFAWNARPWVGCYCRLLPRENDPYVPLLLLTYCLEAWRVETCLACRCWVAAGHRRYLLVFDV